MINAIQLQGLEKQYEGFHLGPLDLELPTGTIMGFVGENGAGKTTTIHLIMNAISRNGGSIEVFGVDNQLSAFQNAKQYIGVVMENMAYPETMNAKQVELCLRGIYQNWDTSRFYELLKQFNLPEKKPLKNFSKGMKMKLSLACALSHQAKLLILDEATSGLDPMAREEILDLLLEFTRDESCSVLLSSHIVSDLEKVCDYIAFLHQGKLRFVEPKDALLERYGLVRCSEDDLNALDPAGILGRREGLYSSEALVDRSLVPETLVFEHMNLEDIILFLSKEA